VTERPGSDGSGLSPEVFLLSLRASVNLYLMQASNELDHLAGLKRSIEGELDRLKALAEQVERVMCALRSAEFVAKVRSIQADAGWLNELRDQYTKEVCERTLEVNGQFPISDK